MWGRRNCFVRVLLNCLLVTGWEAHMLTHLERVGFLINKWWWPDCYRAWTVACTRLPGSYWPPTPSCSISIWVRHRFHLNNPAYRYLSVLWFACLAISSSEHKLMRGSSSTCSDSSQLVLLLVTGSRRQIHKDFRCAVLVGMAWRSS